MSTRKQQRAEARAEREARERAAALKTQRKHRLWLLGGVSAVALVLVVAAVAISGGGSKSKKPTQAQTASLFAGIPQNGNTLGNPSAPVTLEEFADLQCPYCRDYAMGALPDVVRNYVRAGKVKLKFNTVAILGGQSVRAAQAAYAAQNQNHLWDFIDRFYANQGEENTGYVTDQFLKGIASSVAGLDAARVMRDSQTQSSLEQLAAAHARAKELGVDSTPSFFIGKTGGKMQPLTVSSLQPGTFTSAIQRELAR